MLPLPRGSIAITLTLPPPLTPSPPLSVLVNTPRLRIFSLLAIVTSTVGFVYRLVDFFAVRG